MTNEYIEKLNTLIENFISSSITFDQFKSSYSNCYLEEVSDKMLSDADIDFFGRIQEKLDWVDNDFDLESREYGWINEKEFSSWLIDYVKKQS